MCLWLLPSAWMTVSERVGSELVGSSVADALWVPLGGGSDGTSPTCEDIRATGAEGTWCGCGGAPWGRLKQPGGEGRVRSDTSMRGGCTVSPCPPGFNNPNSPESVKWLLMATNHISTRGALAHGCDHDCSDISIHTNKKLVPQRHCLLPLAGWLQPSAWTT